MFQLQVKFNAKTAWQDCTYPPRDKVAAELLLARQSSIWSQYNYRLVSV